MAGFLSLEPDRHELPTDERLRLYQQDDRDPGLAALAFDYGRYLLISSSRPGSQPANLQGIWNREVRPPWSCNFTTNINLEMNYWPALVCGLEETAEPLHDLIRDLSEIGRETARFYYDAEGFAVHHNVDLWGHCNPVGRRRKGGAAHDFWPMGGTWLVQHLYAYYGYTGDRSFLEKTAYPCMREAARFCLDVLSEDGDGHLALIPATSPENRFSLDGHACGVSKTSDMSDAIMRDTFANTLAAARLLKVEPELQKRLEAALERLPPYRIGKDGRLLEWNEEFAEIDPAHRHVSHLFGLYPSHQINAEETPELADACRKSLEGRTDEGTGWSLGWKICLWARLHDGGHALRILKRQFRLSEAESMEQRHQGGGTYPNLLDAHPPFQIDGNFGACAGIAELLVQSGEDYVELLPALPPQWRDGSLSGIRGMGGLRISLAWKDGRLTDAAITSDRERTVEIRLNGWRCRTKLDANKTLSWKGDQPPC